MRRIVTSTNKRPQRVVLRVKAPVWTRNFALAIATNFLLALVFHMLLTIMVLYAVERFAASDAVAGFASSAFVLGATLARVIAGKYMDLIGRKRMLTLSLILFTLASATYLVDVGLAWLLVLRTVHGIAFGLASTSLTASVMAALPPGRRSEGAGYFGVSSTLAMAVGPLIALALGGNFGYEVIFLFGLGCSLATFVTAYFLVLTHPPPSPEQWAVKWRLRARDVADPRAAPFLTVLLVVGVCFSGILVFLNAHTQTLGIPSASGIFFTVFAVTIVVSRTFIGRVQDAKGDNVVMYPALASLAMGLLALGLAPNEWVVGIAAVFSGFGFGAVHSGGQAIAVKLVPAEKVAVATSAFFLAIDFGGGAGPLLAGAVVPFIGLPRMFLALAALMFASTVLYRFVHGRFQHSAATSDTRGAPQ